MASDLLFPGFSKKAVSFFTRLSKNNNKLWFDDHRAEYDKFVLEPSREYVLAMGEKLSKIVPKVVADPRVNKSLFRINRDVRFAKDKSPYKTHMGIWLWEGQLKRMECSGFYFHLDPPQLFIGVGLYRFPKHLLDIYRESVDHEKHGPALARIVKQIGKKGYSVGQEHYKRVPRGYDPAHKRADLLKFNGLHAGLELKVPDEFYSEKFLDFAYKHFKALLPLHKWLLAMTERV
jgi:uncharacterized protein (TIGR02453 family)